MRKCENIFERVQKRTPYRTPEGFFAQQEQTLKQTVCYPPIVNSKSSNRKWIYAVAASALLLIAVYPVMRLFNSSSDQSLTSVSDTAPIYSQTPSASEDWSDFSDADIFMDNMNW